MAPSSEACSQAVEDNRLDGLIEEITALANGGQKVDVEVFAQAYPEHAARLRQLVPAIQTLADFAASASSDLPANAWAQSQSGDILGTLGDFRIVRQIGQGGMGVVYEAIQVSLNRRVAQSASFGCCAGSAAPGAFSERGPGCGIAEASKPCRRLFCGLRARCSLLCDGVHRGPYDRRSRSPTTSQRRFGREQHARRRREAGSAGLTALG